MRRYRLSATFKAIVEGIAEAERGLHAEAVAAQKSGEGTAARGLIDASRELRTLRKRVEEMRGHWGTAFPPELRRRVAVTLTSERGKGHSGPARLVKGDQRLRITLPDARKVIAPESDTQALVELVAHIGPEAVIALGLKVHGCPLIATAPDPRYVPVGQGGHYLCVHSTIQAKKEIVERIARLMRRPIRVEILRV